MYMVKQNGDVIHGSAVFVITRMLIEKYLNDIVRLFEIQILQDCVVLKEAYSKSASIVFPVKNARNDNCPFLYDKNPCERSTIT